MKALLKISGNLVYHSRVIKCIEKLLREYEVDLILGFGAQGSKELEKRGIPFHYNADGIREINGNREKEGLEVLLNVYENIKSDFQYTFGDNVGFIDPIRKEGENIENINADQVLLDNYEKYDKAMVYSLEGRNKEHLKNKGIEVVYLRN